MQYILFPLISYLTLFAVVWLHEIGHSIFDYRYGVKSNWLKVNVKPYIFFSTSGELDTEEWAKLTDRQYLMIAYAGVGVNAIMAAECDYCGADVCRENRFFDKGKETTKSTFIDCYN